MFISGKFGGANSVVFWGAKFAAWDGLSPEAFLLSSPLIIWRSWLPQTRGTRGTAVRVSVCVLSVRLHISKATIMSIIHIFSTRLHAVCDRGSVTFGPPLTTVQ